MALQLSCPFLGLPIELRLIIYGYALVDAPAVTIGSAELVGSHPDIVHRLYGDRRIPFPGLPQNHEPVIDLAYNASLLSITSPAVIPLTPATSCPPEHANTPPYMTRTSLQLTSKRIKYELDTHFNLRNSRQSSVFLSYPSGLHVLKTLASNLLSAAQSIHIAGSYVPRSFSAPRAAQLGSTSHPPFVDERPHGGFTPNSAGQLGTVIASIFGPNPTHPHVRKLELRMYYPGSDSYSTVWGDDSSPVVVALRNIMAGNINVEVWRGRRGTGVYLSTTRPEPPAEGEKPNRSVSTVWRRLEEGRRGEPSCGSWVVDPTWPMLDDERENTSQDDATVVGDV